MLARIVLIAVFGIVTGALASVAALLFVEFVELLNEGLLISPHSRMIAADSRWLDVATVLVPTIGGLIVGLICQAIPEHRPHSVPDAIQSAHNLNATMPLRSGILTALAASVSIGSGASVGQYGPLAHLGATLGSWVGQVTGFGRYIGTIGIGCGAAAAIATAFNAPIAGMVFAHEVILRHYSLRAFAPITVAAAMGYIFANVVFARPPPFRINAVEIANTNEFLLFMLIGIGGALLAILLMKSILAANKIAASLVFLPRYLKPMLAGLTLGCVALWLPDVLGVGKELLRFAIIEDAFTPSELSLILVVKLLVTAMCLGFGFAGGVFSPALLIGILFGALAGTGVEFLFGEGRSHIAVYAICGMVAVTSPVIGAPLTTILIVFELTRNYDLAIAAMVSVVFANLIGYRLFGRSLFDRQLNARGFDLSLGRDRVILQNSGLKEYVIDDFVPLDLDDSLTVVKEKLIAAGQSEGYFRDQQSRYHGTISLNHLLKLEAHGNKPGSKAIDHVEADRLVLTTELSIWDAMEKIEDFVGERIPVITNQNDQTLRGVIYEATLVNAYMQILENIRKEENAAI